MNYKELLIKVIEQGNYVLADMEERVTRLWLEGKITEADRDELLPLAAEHASDRYQVDVIAELADLSRRVWELEHPVDQYVIWTPGYKTQQHEIVRFDVTGDGELDLCQYNGGRSYTALSIGKIEGWNLLDRELNIVATITRDSDGGYVITPVNAPESADEGDEIRVDGKCLTSAVKRLYILLNKPRGYVTTLHDEKGRRDVTQLLRGVEERVYPVGRLDRDSEGLLLLTNDGAFANRLMHPSHEVKKVYETWVEGGDLDTALAVLRGPLELDGYRLRPARVEPAERLPGGARLFITIHEGRNRQVRRMCELAGLRVTRLRRVREGSLELGDLPTGRWRFLSEEEVRRLEE